jgi:acetoin utilization deacetylase AcuC-like enzyme
MDIFASDAHRSHDTVELSRGLVVASSESPRRDIIAEALLADGHRFRTPVPLDRSLLERVHAPAYVEFLETAWQRWADRFGTETDAIGFTWPASARSDRRPTDLVGQLGYHSFAVDTAIGSGTWDACVESAALAQTAAEAVAAGSGTTYALCRPPGPHATRDQFGGYCYLANASIAAQRLLDRGAERVAVLDVDYHHGNGTQAIFWDRSDVLTISIHADPRHEFPWFVGHADEIGTGDGEG